MKRNTAALVALVLVVTAVVGALVVLTGIGDVPSSTGGTPAVVDTPVAVEGLHNEGYTGESVAVGVIDVTDVDGSQPAVADGLVESRKFGDGGDIFGGGARTVDHGTAATSLVSSVAPDAELYFASIDDERSFEAAVDWLLDADVDVIVAPVSFYGKPGDGTSFVDRAASHAVEEGVVFVAPAGNLGQGHWRGRFLPTDGGYQQFEGDRRNRLDGGGERLVLWLSWTDPTREFTLELHRDGDDEPIARSRPYDDDAYPNERIVTTVDPDADLSVALRGPTGAAGSNVRITSPTHDLAVGQRAGSLVPPGTAPGTLTVGAYDRETGIVEPFSSAGPTSDGRTGIDVVAPNRFAVSGADGEFFGTSAASPYVAGVVALVLEANPELSPVDVTDIVTSTADDTAPYDDEKRVGGGTLQPGAAVERAAATDSDGNGATEGDR